MKCDTKIETLFYQCIRDLDYSANDHMKIATPSGTFLTDLAESNEIQFRAYTSYVNEQVSVIGTNSDFRTPSSK